MPGVRTFTGFALVAAMVTCFSSSFAFAEHLDRLETRRIVRHLEERSDLLQDHVYSWVAERREEREHRAEEMLHAGDHFDQTLAQFKLDLYNHDEPWELRENAHRVLEAAAEFGRSVERGEWHGELRHEWEDMRDTANELARHFHLPEIGR